MRFALPLVPCSLPRSGLAMLRLFLCLQSCWYFCWAPRLCALPVRFFSLPPTPCCLLPIALHPLLSTSCVSVLGCVCAAVGISADRHFFSLCFRDGSSPCPLFLSLSLLAITPPSHCSVLLSRHSRRAPRLHTLPTRWFSCLAAFLYAAAHGGRPDVVRASGLSGLFEVWLAVPGSGAASLAGQVFMRFAFAAILLPVTFTSVCCRGYSGSFPFSFLSWPVFSALISACCRSWALAALARGGGQ